MLLKELRESDEYDPKSNDLGPKAIMEILNDDCGDWMKAVETYNKRIYRGFKDAGYHNMLSGPVRVNRRPLEMPQSFQDLIDWGMRDIGLKARRGNSLFCTTDLDIAARWGSPYILFMKDGWSATVFHKVRDNYLFMSLKNAALRILDDDSDKYDHDPEVQKDRMVDELMSLHPENIATPIGLVSVMNDNFRDILVTGPGYYAVRAGWAQFELELDKQYHASQ